MLWLDPLDFLRFFWSHAANEGEESVAGTNESAGVAAGI